MIRSRVFVFLAISLFLAGCLCAEATGGTVEVADEKKANEKVTELQAFTARVLKNAETKFTRAEGTKSTVESQKTKADKAESDAKTAAQTITATDRKAQADAVVLKATEELEKCNTLYNAAKAKADQASKSLDGFVKRARALVQSAQIVIPDASSPQAKYEEVIASAADFTGQTTALSTKINQSTVLSAADIALSSLREGAKKVQALKYQAESIVIVSNIEAKLKTGETDIESIQQKEKEIDAIVKAMEKTFQSAPEVSKGFLRSLCTNAGGFLRTATTKVTEANKYKKIMLDRKTQLDQTLQTLMATTEESEANTQAGNVKWHVNDIDGELQKIKEALRTAETSVSSAKGAEKQMQDEMSKHNSPSGTKLNEGNPQDNARTAEVTNTIQNREVKNPTTTKTDQTALEKSKDTTDKTSEQPVNTHLDSNEQNKSTQLTHKEKGNPKNDKSQLLNKDKVHNITKDITNNPLIGGEVPSRSAANDSAVTVFIPLLVILVISAVLH